MLTKEKIDKIVQELTLAAAERKKKSDKAAARTMAGYHKGVQDAYEMAVAVLDGISSGGNESVRYLDMLLTCIDRIGRAKISEGTVATAYSAGFCEGRADGSEEVQRLIRIADKEGK